MSPAESGEDRLFAGAGEIGVHALALDWASTPLGPIQGWPPALRNTVRTVLEAPLPICLWCGPELVLIYNDAYAGVLRDKHPAALGRAGSEVWGEIWPQIAPMFERIRAGGPAVYAEDAPFTVVRAGGEPAADSSNAWFTFSLSPVRDEGGRIVAFVNVVAETTERVLAQRAREAVLARAERAERQLREVFAQAPAFLTVLRGEQYMVEYVNAAYYELVGQRELIGRPLFEAMPEVRGQGFEALLDSVLATGRPFVGREVPLRVTRGGVQVELFVDLVYYPVTEADGTRSGVVAHGSDVTAHVLARREAQRARAQAEAANQAKSHFLANMSHEIRTPINAVVGFTDLLDLGIAGPLTERQQEYLARIKASSNHLLGLVNDVLDLSKVEAGEMPVAMEAARARDVVSSALEMVAPQARAAGLELRKEWECDATVELLGDTDRVRQIVLNLLSNALKFTPRGGRVIVRCRLAEQNAGAALPDLGPWVVIDVEDTGIGITPEDTARIFEPFMQVEGSRVSPLSGTGLGLTISRRLARLMGGDLTVRSELDAGSCFSLWLARAAHERVLDAGQVWVRAEGWPQQPQEIPGLSEVGAVLYEATERLQEEFVDRLRGDARIGAARSVGRRELADHTAAVLAVMAKTLTELDDTGGDMAALRESEDIQALLCGWHGRQRRRLGWTRADLTREYDAMHDILDTFLRREVPRRTVADIGGALGIVHVLVDRAAAASVATYAGAVGAGTD